MAKRRIFSVRTPLDQRVILTRDRWREIVRYKHPAMKGHEQEVEACLSDPEFVRRSEKKADVHLYYRPSGEGYICVVVAGEDPNALFVVTAYFTKKPKAGEELWTR